MVVEVDKNEGGGEEDLKRVRVAIPPYPVLSPLLILPTLFFSIFDLDQERRNNKHEERKAEEKEKEARERKRI